MIKLVDKNTNQVNFGIHDETIDFNWNDYVIHNFWDKKIKYFKRKFSFHKFHFISFINNDYIVGLAIVDVAVAKNIFGYVYHKDEGIVTKWQKGIINPKIKFTDDIDNNCIDYTSNNMKLKVQRNLNTSTINYLFEYKKIIKLTAQIESSLKHQPLRVINPIDFDHWSFTDKRPGLRIKTINVLVHDKLLPLTPSTTLASTDWSGGFFQRSTNWAWANGAVNVKGDIIGFNFAVFHNNALYPENAVWFNNQREHIRNIILKWDYKDPYTNGMEVYTTDNRLHLHFQPFGQKSDVHARMLGLVKTNFHQFFGFYTGYVTVANRKIILPKFLGLFELHKALW